MNNLYALIIAINEYPLDKHELMGCVNDANNLNEFLLSYSHSNDYIYQPKLLFDHHATRKNIVEGFTHFNNSNEGDVCVFYYGGHGSQCPSYPEFQHTEFDRLSETLVCYDSRMEGGFDLIDKELGYLIYKATTNDHKRPKNIHFVAIVDSCHAGNVTRVVQSEARIRSLTPNDNRLPLAKYFGLDEYLGDGIFLNVPIGNHILMAACQSGQSAQERSIYGEWHGLFTYSLMHTIQVKKWASQSYHSIMNATQSFVYDQNPFQIPNLESYGLTSSKLPFLNANSDHVSENFSLSFSKVRGWNINAGRIHGITYLSRFEVDNINQKLDLSIKDVKASYSAIHDLKMNKATILNVKLIDIGPSKLPVSLGESFQNRTFEREAICNLLTGFKGSYVHLLPHPQPFVIDFVNESFFLRRQGQSEELPPIFRPISFSRSLNKYQDNLSALEFLEHLHRFAKWSVLKNTSGQSDAHINFKDVLKLELRRITDHKEYLKVLEYESIEDLESQVKFSYQKIKDKWMEPSFQLSIKNISNQPVWVSILYMTEDYAITDSLLSPTRIDPTYSPVTISYFDEVLGKYLSVVPININSILLDSGIRECLNYLKIIVSNHVFDSTALCQEAIPLAGTYRKDEVTNWKGPGRDEISETRFPEDFWLVKNITFKIITPEKSNTH